MINRTFKKQHLYKIKINVFTVTFDHFLIVLEIYILKYYFYVSSLFRVFVPEFSSRLDVFILNCSVKLGNDCGLSITVGSNTLKQGSEVKQNCSGLESCSASVLIPPWNSWLLVTVETSQPNTTIPFSISANVTGLFRFTYHFNFTFLPAFAWFLNVFPPSLTSYTQWDVNL